MVKNLNIGGEERPIKWGFNAIAMFEEFTGRAFILSAENPSIRDSISMVFFALKDGARAEGIEFKNTFEDVADWLDDSDYSIGQIFKILEGFLPAKKKKAQTLKAV